MKKNLKFLAVFALVAFLFVGCEKDGLVEEQTSRNKALTVNAEKNYPFSKSLLIDAEQSFPVPKSPTIIKYDSVFVRQGVADDANVEEKWKLDLTSKGERGFFGPHNDPENYPFYYVEEGQANVLGASKKYVTMKVVRNPDVPGDYFYVMCENLNITGSDYGNNYIAYDFDNEYAEEYGYLYSWNEAMRLANKVYMELPMVYNGVEYSNGKIKCFGKLPSRDDLQYIFNQNVPFLPEQMEGLTANTALKYYDAFVTGLDINDNSKYTTVGYADNMKYWKENPQAADYQRFFEKGIEGSFWTSDQNGAFAYPLMITRNYNKFFLAYINVACAKEYGMSVRYVFYPPVY